MLSEWKGNTTKNFDPKSRSIKDTITPAKMESPESAIEEYRVLSEWKEKMSPVKEESGIKERKSQEFMKPMSTCFYELHEKDSCKYGKKCKFSHFLTPKSRNDPATWKYVRDKINNSKIVGDWNKPHHFLENIVKEMINKETIKIRERNGRR